MRFVIVALIVALFAGCSPETPKQAPQQDIVHRDRLLPFPEATEVRLMVDSGKTDKRGETIFTHPEGKRLTPAQRAAFEGAVWIETPVKVSEYWGLRPSCFLPHHFFGYYDAAGRKLGQIELCFCCAGVQVSPDTRVALAEGAMINADYGSLEKLVASMGEPTQIGCAAD